MALVPDASTRTIGTSASCSEKAGRSAHNQELILGVFNPGYSRKGLVAKQCNKLAWWHNGKLMGNYGDDTADDDVDDILEQRGTNTLMELRRGDLLAFRFKSASYHCYNSYSSFVVNGTSIDTNSPGVTSHFAKGFVADWYSQTGSVSFAPEEENAAVTDFVPLRKNALLDNSTIVFGNDLWKAPGGSQDDAISNFYYRIQL